MFGEEASTNKFRTGGHRILRCWTAVRTLRTCYPAVADRSIGSPLLTDPDFLYKI